MESKYAGFIPFKDEWNWWANFSDNLATCTGCGLDFESSDLNEDTGYCADCHAKIASAVIVIVDEDDRREWCNHEPEYCESRARWEAKAYLGGW
jgi:protein-arginine kinase activator protein McsA